MIRYCFVKLLLQNTIGLEQKFVAFFSFKIFIFYKISMTPFDRAKFQLSESVLQITVRFLMEL